MFCFIVKIYVGLLSSNFCSNSLCGLFGYSIAKKHRQFKEGDVSMFDFSDTDTSRTLSDVSITHFFSVSDTINCSRCVFVPIPNFWTHIPMS